MTMVMVAITMYIFIVRAVAAGIIVAMTAKRSMAGLLVADVIMLNSVMIATRRRMAWTQYEPARVVASTPVVNVWFQIWKKRKMLALGVSTWLDASFWRRTRKFDKKIRIQKLKSKS